jgi:protocatechuate 3,4-dioxygenase beta subunit
MKPIEPFLTRRGLLRGGIALGAMALTAPRLLAAELTRTPPLTEGPFYPDRLPLDQDNDLLIVHGNTTQAAGEVTHLSGRVLSRSGEPIRNAVVEIWQVDHRGVYLNTADSGHRQRDTNFQGFGRFETGSTGEYRFRTIKPVPYTGRTPHIHVKVKKGGRELLTTQIFVNGDPQNRSDMVLGGLRDPFDRELVLVDFKPMLGSKQSALSARFDIIVGATPQETADGALWSPLRGV